MSFTVDLRNFRNLTVGKIEKIYRQSALDLFSSIVLQTPVDKGVLRNNWWAEIGSPSQQASDVPDPSGQTTIDRIRVTVNGAEIEQNIFLTNNLPYAAPIEFDGHSAQAPDGMVRVNTVRWDTIVNNNVRRFG